MGANAYGINNLDILETFSDSSSVKEFSSNSNDSGFDFGSNAHSSSG